MILYWIIRICVPSPQSIKKLCSAFCTTWAVGCRLKAGIAELFTKMVMASIILNVRCQMYDVRCMILEFFFFFLIFLYFQIFFYFFISLLNSTINSKKKSDSSISSSAILNLFIKSALDFALLVAL